MSRCTRPTRWLIALAEPILTAQAEVERLRRQVDVSFSKELQQLRAVAGLADGARLLELGCGPGWSTLRFVAALPSSHVTCVELDAKFVERALENFASPRLASRVTVRLDALRIETSPSPHAHLR
tara:strand:- start:15 stop:389 length:375 start_codon:yes stop_codon:yes gene_type:complete